MVICSIVCDEANGAHANAKAAVNAIVDFNFMVEIYMVLPANLGK